jgi:hypothetical protein
MNTKNKVSRASIAKKAGKKGNSKQPATDISFVFTLIPEATAPTPINDLGDMPIKTIYARDRANAG